MKAAPGDAAVMARLEHAQFLETVLTGEDLASRYDETLAAFEGYEVGVVHAPFRVPGGGEVDVAADDAAHRERSIEMWRLSCALARELGARWVVVHPGGIVPGEVAGGPIGGEARARALELTTEALVALADDGARDRVLVENMPAHYRRADGRLDRCLAGQGVMDFYGWLDHAAGICLDVSHAALTPGGTKTLEAFVRRGRGRVRHLHLGDAEPPHGEGLPLGEGVVDWDRLARQVADLEEVRALTAVPEVHGGHENGGAGFVEALRFARERFAGA